MLANKAANWCQMCSLHVQDRLEEMSAICQAQSMVCTLPGCQDESRARVVGGCEREFACCGHVMGSHGKHQHLLHAACRRAPMTSGESSGCVV